MSDKIKNRTLIVGLLLSGGLMLSGGSYSYSQSAAPVVDKQLEDALKNSTPAAAKPSGPRQTAMVNGVLVEVEPVLQVPSPPAPDTDSLNVPSLSGRAAPAPKKAAVFNGPQSTDETPAQLARSADQKPTGKYVGPQSTDQTPAELARSAQQKPTGEVVGRQSTDDTLVAAGVRTVESKAVSGQPSTSDIQAEQARAAQKGAGKVFVGPQSTDQSPEAKGRVATKAAPGTPIGPQSTDPVPNGKGVVLTKAAPGIPIGPQSTDPAPRAETKQP